MESLTSRWFDTVVIGGVALISTLALVVLSLATASPLLGCFSLAAR